MDKKSINKIPNFIVIGENTKAQGINFEKFLKKLLKILGYSKIENLRRTGMEVDLKGEHIMTKREVFVEAKGYNYNNNVPTKEVNAFKTKYDTHKKRNNSEECDALFITTTDFAWEVKDSNERDDEVLSEIKLINSKRLSKLLIQSKLIPSRDLISIKIGEQIPFKREKKKMIIHDGELFWLQFFSNEAEEINYYSIFKNDGMIINHKKSKEIIKLLNEKITELTFIDLDVHLLILSHLLKKEKATAQEISSEIGVSVESIQLNLDFLNRDEKIVKFYEDSKYFLSNDYDGLKSLMKLVYSTRTPSRDLLAELLVSQYFKEALNDRIIEHIFTKFAISNIDDADKEKIKKCLILFPSALQYCLFEEDLRFFLTNPQTPKDINASALKFKIFEKMMYDLFNEHKLMKAILLHHQLRDQLISGNLMLLKEKNLFLHFNAERLESLVKIDIKKPIEPGTPLTLVDKAGFIGIIASLIEFKLYERAIERASEFLSDPILEEHYYGFLINKGVAFSHLGRTKEAIECYEGALEYGKEIPLLYKNFINAWEGRYIQSINRQKDFPIFVNFLLDYLINAQNYLEKLESIEINDDEKVRIGDLREIRRNLESNFDSFTSQCIPLMEENQIPIVLNHIICNKIDLLNDIYKKNKETIDKLLFKHYYDITPGSWNILANFYKLVGDNEKALSSIEKGLTFIKNSPQFLTLLDTKAEIQFQMSKFKESLENFSKIIEIDKDDHRVKFFYAETCWKASLSAKALGDIERFRELKEVAKQYAANYCKNKEIKKLILENE